ncbi:hypothetical protein GC722_07835 [Auraticoccus sp. F435]|uniref:GrpB family protein n=1 Tax=Auraticoccus cholistanensis TaxID=2656650 RepID=A0A6A9UTC5_9ACTN|nr:hypothetical protein [Auraticoccus cholistanensis]MVA75931.1 hypothetical protein [Auraticoccus cholistanensis]
MLPLRWSDEVLPLARRVLAVEQQRLAALGVPGELVLTGASSLPGVLTRGDVDLHLRVAPERFDAAVAALRRVHPVVHPEIWSPGSLATFALDTPGPDTPGLDVDLPAGLAVTALGSEHDVRFTRCWAVLAAEPELVSRLNQLKRSAARLGEGEYEHRKSTFFDSLLRDPPGSGAAEPSA